MEFSFSEDQNELRRAARRFLEVASSEARVRSAMETERGYDPATWAQLSEELAWTALTIPEEYGGLGLSYLDLHPLMEEIGRALLCAPFLSTVGLGANALMIGGSEAQKELYLPGIAAGETRATLAFAETNGRMDAAGVEASYVRNGAGYLLSGAKSYVLDGHTADLLIVAARSERSAGTGPHGVSLFLVPKDADGLKRKWLPTMDQTRRMASVELLEVTVPDDALLGDEGKGWWLCERTLDLARIALAAEQVGAAEMCLEMSVEYAKVRKQFGRPIGSFQAIKHKCADMLTLVESARSAAFYASALATQGGESLEEAASSAKAYCSDAFFHCASEMIQIHGGIGFTWEHPAHLYFKRAKATENLFGGPAFHRERVAAQMGL
ncbi:MAG: acyl-CoA/acyl-ACP dehydrogenase [Deltaproteobacteria bacterium]|nr:acyl-CoA/acyl-ACP dehydrogenase [Deltaproteobacteria bacterium]NND29602.1 acyl-CoA/acyl-ACP dehydrogenase [Myxococcales bacterium]MBT8463588.1 acyl-CoA/acyl-ACP dehydrogenase [Deltaproteobacteria bacterium]MBT8482402.1 acyl-CoA/acyl-ACP dehydrogenase [Deltaproteobacteria bacterium]NNK08690.1 acyl-CoA/acyl-ACP dehydrogenase [Myxococcales bacterium]